MPHRVEMEHCGCRDRDPNDQLPEIEPEVLQRRVGRILAARCDDLLPGALSPGEQARLDRWRIAPAPRSCPRCKQPVEVQIWGLSVIELMVHEWREHGFITGSIVGLPEDHPGRRYALKAGRALFELSVRCERCLGVGVDTAPDERWRYCPDCQGMGRIPTAPLETRVSEHRRWYDRWPKYFVWSKLYGLDDVALGRPHVDDPRTPIVVGMPH